MTLPAFAAERRAAAPLLLARRYRSRVLLAGRSAANWPHAAATANDVTEERTDRRTDGHPTVT